MSVTIKDIARMANVSHTTVSRALNDSPLINAETKERIKQIARSLNYTPNFNAKSLVLERSYNIGLFFSTLRSGTSATFFYSAVAGVNGLIHGKYNLVVKGIDDYLEGAPLSRKMFDGILVVSQSSDDMGFIRAVREAGIPLVVLNRSPEGVASIRADDRIGSDRITQYMIDQGHTELAMIEGMPGFSSSYERKQGFIQALVRNGIDPAPHRFVPGNYDVESGYRGMRLLLEQERLPTAVFCANDDMAVGAMKAVQEAGLKVPDDISLAGFDDSSFARYLTPALTTVRRPIEQISRLGTERLLDMIDRKTRPDKAEAELIDTVLVIRDSVKRITR
ncbi:LacI family DNA-binding transcriptional regulator [Paenibacillus thermoaerophilus]|uniref:LacI family DNA-binding transcriptional regulator n=1 Tax=Paenibacillus thermoaerophilus TaxID=1215385 RepID=A0ABW2V5S0_9BACL|nr:LacI family DNA-binding transcriptional regulator [Paenibacillus thermoaerophilus]TMV18756.1 LacI family transcriptional regulator [Paenibacillus thermoaerophilus]